MLFVKNGIFLPRVRRVSVDVLNVIVWLHVVPVVHISKDLSAADEAPELTTQFGCIKAAPASEKTNARENGRDLWYHYKKQMPSYSKHYKITHIHV